jgi:methylmalonyl-CoA mutase cobalamin-binding subunit
MGLLMAEALLTLEGVYCVPLGVETPATDIVAAALAHDVDIVTISFSSAFPARLATGSIRELREMLPARMALWVGGDAMLRARTPGEGIEVLRGLDHIIAALGEWRARLSD